MPFAMPSPLSSTIGTAPLTLPSGPVAESCGTLCAHAREENHQPEVFHPLVVAAATAEITAIV